MNLSLRKSSQGEWVLPLDFVPTIPNTSFIYCQSVGFFRSGARQSRLYPVVYGLNLLPVELPDAPAGWDVFWPMPNQETDYAGLTVVQNERFADLREAAVEWLQRRK